MRFEFTLATHGQEILAGMARGAAERLQRHLSLRQISLLHGFSADRIEGDTVVSTSGQRLQADVAVWATGAQAYPWLGRAGLPVNAQGFVKIDAMLRSVRSSRVFATGDWAAWEPALPKAGVYAVLKGPVLAHNLRAVIKGRALRAYKPRRRHLVLVGTGGVHAVAAWGPFSWEGAWVWRWKEAIDRRFIRRTQRV